MLQNAIKFTLAPLNPRKGLVRCVLTTKLSLGINLAPSYSSANRINESRSYGGNKDGVVVTALFSSPFFPARNENGIANPNVFSDALSGKGNNPLNLARLVNPISLAEETDITREQFRLLGSIFLNYELIDGLEFKSQLHTDVYFREDDLFNPSTIGTRNVAAPDDSFC